MKKFLLALVVLTGAAFSSFAQSGGDGGFSIGVEAGLPLGETKNTTSFIIGGSLKYDIPVAESFFVTGSAGYSVFMYSSDFKDFLKALGSDKSSEGFIPVKAGAKYFFSEGFFGEAQVGAVFSTVSGGGTGFAYSPGIGYAFDGGFEIGGRYEGWSVNGGTISQASLRLAYRF